VVVLTEVFVSLAAAAATARGFGTLRQLVLLHPMESRPREEIVAITRARLDEIVHLLTSRA